MELVNYVPTGTSFHAYINPERDMPLEAFNIHGLSADFLRDKSIFRSVANKFIRFIGNSNLVIHNAEFDMRFINFELKRINAPQIGMERVLDTLALARKKHPGASNSLDALCARYKINTSKRVKHGALVDAELLADVYIELIGGRQTIMNLPTILEKKVIWASEVFRNSRQDLLPSYLCDEVIAQHERFIATFKAPMIWADYENQAEA